MTAAEKHGASLESAGHWRLAVGRVHLAASSRRGAAGDRSTETRAVLLFRA